MQDGLHTEGVLYLDEAATSWPKAPGVVEAIASVVAEPPTPLDGERPGRCQVMRECRERLARLFGVTYPERVILTNGATHALNIALFGLAQFRGARVITSCAEHEAVLRPLLHLRERRRLHLTIIGLEASGDLDRDAFSTALVRGTSLVVLTHASHVTGRVFDVAPLFALARSVGAHTLLDASQTVGEIRVQPEELAADMVAFSGHKRLRGPSGTGGLYLDPRVTAFPVLTRTARTHCGILKEAPGDIPTGFDTGRPAVEAFAGLCAALRWHAEEGAACAQKGRRLAAVLRQGLRRIPGVQLMGDIRRAPRVPVVSLRVAGQSVLETQSRLEARFGVRCSAGLHAAPLMHKAIGSLPEGTVRFGVSGFNTDGEIARALAAVRRVSAERASLVAR